jgi:hypothetical protein
MAARRSGAGRAGGRGHRRRRRPARRHRSLQRRVEIEETDQIATFPMRIIGLDLRTKLSKGTDLSIDAMGEHWHW